MTKTLSREGLSPSPSGEIRVLQEAPLKGMGGRALQWEITGKDGVTLFGISEHPEAADPSQFVALLSPDAITLGQRKKELGKPSVVTNPALKLGMSVIDILAITVPSVSTYAGTSQPVIGREQRTDDILSGVDTLHHYLGSNREAGLSIAVHNLMSRRRLDPDVAFNNSLGINTREVITHANPYHRRPNDEVIDQYAAHLPKTQQLLNTPSIKPPKPFELFEI